MTSAGFSADGYPSLSLTQKATGVITVMTKNYIDALKEYKEAYDENVAWWNSLPGSKIDEPFAIRYCYCRGEIEPRDLLRVRGRVCHRTCGYPVQEE